ncbi:MAG TPA: hypothetical protein VGL86_05515 [Polyangia bacterium]|jgi:hypothetical protein
MRAVVLVVVAAGACVLAGCRDDSVVYLGPDLSAPSLYCPDSPPDAGAFVCDPTSIPFCTYPAQHETCFCVTGGDGYTLSCGNEVQPDGGLPTGTGT